VDRQLPPWCQPPSRVANGGDDDTERRAVEEESAVGILLGADLQPVRLAKVACTTAVVSFWIAETGSSDMPQVALHVSRLSSLAGCRTPSWFCVVCVQAPLYVVDETYI
jgi:hypothetical protein